MRVKDLERTVNVAWSPATHHPILLAAGTAAQQLDASFNTTAALELFSLSLSEPGADMEKVAGTPTDQRFHQVVWGSGSGDSGIIVGGCDGGIIQVYSATKMLAQQEALVARKDGHNGAVRALDINPFQSNLLASGASDSEIFIWDLEQMGSPMTPGAKAQPPDVVGWLSWNRQVQHILASTFPSRCVVWDLRKNEPIIKLADTTSHVRWKSVNWHPDVATQLCLASEDDMSPVVQLWDLRFATSPLKVLANHTRGVSCIAWCQHDPDLLLSCARDNRILCWNPNENIPGAELLCEIQTPQQWLFDVAWCPRNPSLISSSSFDGHVSIYCLTGGQQQIIPTTSKIADSFPGMESFAPAMAPQPHVQTTVDLRKPPKWLRRPAGVSFAFGGRLVQFGSDQPGRVVINQMVSEPELLERAAKLDNALSTGQQAAFCLEQASTASTEHLRTLWRFLAAEFSGDPRSELLTLLGYPADKVNVQFSNALTKANPDLVKQLTNDVANLSTSEEQKTEGSPDKSSAFEPYQRPELNGIDGHTSQETAKEQKPFYIPASNGVSDADSLIGQALLLGHTETAVELCIRQDRMADALLLAMTGGAELLARTQYRYFEKCSGWLSRIISAAVSEDWSSVVSHCTTSSWEQALAAAITHTTGDEFYALCEHLGARLEAENDTGFSKSAQVCYLCSGNIDKLVQSWGNEGAPTNSLQLQELVQVAALLQAAERQQGRQVQTSLALAQLMTNYAFLLASQGSFHSALNYLESAHEEAALELKDRLQKSLGISGPGVRQHVAPRTSLSTQGRRTSGHLLAQPTYPQMADQVYESPLSYKARSRTTSQSSSYDAQQAAYPSAYNNTFPPVSASPVPYMQPSFTAPPNTPPTTNTGVKPTGLAGRKYVADPSVQSSSPYGGQMYNSSTYGSNQAYGGVAQSVSPFMPQQQTQPTPMMPTMYNPSTMIQDNQPEVAQAPAPPRQVRQPFISHQGPPGWNDPPPMSENKQSKPEFVPQTPITHPLFGAAPSEPAAPSNTPGQMNGGMYGAPTAAPPMMQNSYTQPQGYPTSFSPQPQAYMQPAPQIQPPVAQATIAEPPKPKPPIPEAYAYLPQIFDELRDRCANAAGNPQTRRKLEDVARKLESLYDSLREYKLSATTLAGLQQMAQFVQGGDYSSGLLLHTQMVSGPDFSQISAFMPGLKMLLQTSLQLGVYLQ